METKGKLSKARLRTTGKKGYHNRETMNIGRQRYIKRFGY
jgi:hypothetical protein